MTRTPPHNPTDSRLVRSLLDRAHIQTLVCTRQDLGAGRFGCPPRTLNDYNLIYVTRGRPVWLIGGLEVALEPGRLLIVPIGTPHEAHTGPTHRVTLLSLHVTAELPGGRDLFAMLNPAEVRDVEQGGRLDRYLRGALSEFDRADSADTYAAMPSWCRLIVHEMLRTDAAGGRLDPVELDPLIVDLIEVLHDRIGRQTTLDDLAAAAGYSAQHLNRVFGAAVGVTPLRYLAALRMRHAASALARGRQTVEAVARETGFEDPFYFSRQFRKAHGMSPSRYREQYGSENPA